MRFLVGKMSSTMNLVFRFETPGDSSFLFSFLLGCMISYHVGGHGDEKAIRWPTLG